VPEAQPLDPNFTAFALAFDKEHNARYGGVHGSTVRPEGQATIANSVLDLTAEAHSWAQTRGLTLDRDEVQRDLCHLLARTWLTWTGTSDALVQRRHPIGMIVGDLGRLGPQANDAWKRAQRRPAQTQDTPGELAPATEPDASKPAQETRAAAPADRGVPPTPEFLAFVASMQGPAPARPLTIEEPPRPDPEQSKLALIKLEGAPEPMLAAESVEAPIATPAESAPATSAEALPTRRRHTRTRLALAVPAEEEHATAPVEEELTITSHPRRRRLRTRLALAEESSDGPLPAMWGGVMAGRRRGGGEDDSA
jgi:hypothetical protein